MKRKAYILIYTFSIALVIIYALLTKISDYFATKIEEYSSLERELIRIKSNLNDILKVSSFSTKSYNQAKFDVLNIIDELAGKFEVKMEGEIKTEGHYIKATVDLSSDVITKDKIDTLMKYVNSDSPVFIIKYFEIYKTERGHSFKGTVEIKDVFFERN